MGDRFVWQTTEGHRCILLYFILINLFGVLIMALDKYKAEKEKWRISEKTIFIVTILGGGIGTIFGMYKFRHKTKKLYFTIRTSYNINFRNSYIYYDDN